MVDSIKGLISFEIDGNIKRDILFFFLSNMYYLEKNCIRSRCIKIEEKINDAFSSLEIPWYEYEWYDKETDT